MNKISAEVLARILDSHIEEKEKQRNRGIAESLNP